MKREKPVMVTGFSLFISYGIGFKGISLAAGNFISASQTGIIEMKKKPV